MSSEPWDVPRTEEGRDQLIQLINKYQRSGQLRELGCSLSRLAHIVKHVGAPDDLPAFPASAAVGAEAVQVLRQVGDKRELALALVHAAVPMCDVEHAALLNEALALSREIKDKEVEGWVLFRMTRANGVPGHTIKEALACFEEAGCNRGIATCLTSLGFEPATRDPELLQRAIALYEDEGMAEDAERARVMLGVIAEE
jgi:hypothetical protein